MTSEMIKAFAKTGIPIYGSCSPVLTELKGQARAEGIQDVGIIHVD